MNNDDIEGTVREGVGRVKAGAGALMGDASTEAQGHGEALAGKAQQYYGEAVDQVRGVSEELTDRIHESPLLAVLAAAGIGYLLGRITAR